MKNHNLILLADAYKYSHHKLYYLGTSHVYSYLESRGGKFSSTVFYGLQYFLKQYFEGVVITQEDIEEAKTLMPQVFGRDDVFDASKFQYIVDVHGGKLPIKIIAVKEGSIVPTKNVLLTIENTDPNCYWLTNFLETILMQIWYPNTVATLSFEIRKLLLKYYQETASDESFGGIDYVLNDFGFRGVSSLESAGIGGSAHLLSFDGSDTIAASMFARKYYGSQEMAGKSIPATEHSIMTLLGKEGEKDMMQHVISSFKDGLVACVSDSYNIFEACAEYWGTDLKEQVVNRNGTLVIRPDSGDPVATLLKVFEILFDKFGFTLNDKGFKVLPSQIRVIQGDGVNYDSIADILEALKMNGISAENLVLGMGGALLQKLDRDTQKFALKCSYAKINGQDIDVSKSPTEMDADGNLHESFKKSKAGKLKLIKTKDGYQTVKQHELPEYEDQLVTVFENGEVLVEYQFEELKESLRAMVNGDELLVKC
jgi:nicotinamide phosphoribosyltransferase